MTFWSDVAPIYNNKCVRCHQQGGIAPFRLDNYADAKAYSTLEKARVNQGTMPPYFMVHDGTCQNFQDDITLSDQQKATINAWVDGGTPEGTPTSPLTLPPQPSLPNASDVATPSFMPVPQGGALAEFDEYRCFVMDWPHTGDGFLTGYEVSPGDAAIVHHVIGFVVDPAAMGDGGRTNAAIMQDLQAQSPDRIGWPCFGGAGDGVNPTGLPIAWAPGQGVVTFPDGHGGPGARHRQAGRSDAFQPRRPGDAGTHRQHDDPRPVRQQHQSRAALPAARSLPRQHRQQGQRRQPGPLQLAGRARPTRSLPGRRPGTIWGSTASPRSI